MRNEPKSWTWRDRSIEEMMLRNESSKDHLYNILNYYVNKGSVLEAGCGDGRYVLSFALKGLDSFGVDFNKETIKKNISLMKHIKGLSFDYGDVRDLFYKKFSFDNYVSLGVIEHLNFKDQQKIIKEAYRVLKNNGTIFIEVPNKHTIFPFFRYIYSTIYPDKYVYCKSMSCKEVRSLCENEGFKTVKSYTSNVYGSFERSFFLKDRKVKGIYNPFYFIRKPIKMVCKFFESFTNDFGYLNLYIGKKESFKEVKDGR